MNSFLQLIKYLGAFAAVVLCIGFISKTDLNTAEKQDFTLAESNTDSNNDDVRIASYGSSTASVPRNRPVGGVVAPPATYSSNADDQVRPSRRNISAREIETWIQNNAAQTYLEAEKETMSPGVILATGVYFLQQGQGDMSMNSADVASYLSEVRKSASANAKSHMKYVANSEEWFTGLSLAGFDGDKVSSIFNTHQLAAYDKQMYARLAQRKVEEADYAVESSQLAADTDVSNRNLADAYNDYIDSPEVKEKYSLPTFVASEPMNSSEVSEGRRAAEAFSIGESKTYDNPRFFWSVLQEMIALENDFNNWDDYKTANTQAAEKEFQDRSNIMSMGGVMKVTRKRGA